MLLSGVVLTSITPVSNSPNSVAMAASVPVHPVLNEAKLPNLKFVFLLNLAKSKCLPRTDIEQRPAAYNSNKSTMGGWVSRADPHFRDPQRFSLLLFVLLSTRVRFPWRQRFDSEIRTPTHVSQDVWPCCRLDLQSSSRIHHKEIYMRHDISVANCR